MARGKHSSPQRTDFSKRKKSIVKTAKMIKQNEALIKKLQNG
jgi:hypothetical protein